MEGDLDFIVMGGILVMCCAALVFKVARANSKALARALPAASPPLEEPPLFEDLSAGALMKSVLIVDDDIVTRKQLSIRLKKLGFSVSEVSDGASAVELFEEGHRFSLVVMDFEMPDMNGVSATRKIRVVDKDVVIVGSTIHDPAIVQQDFLKAGANYVDIKPIAAETLNDLLPDPIALD